MLNKKDADDWNMSKKQVQQSWLTYLQQVLMKNKADDWNMLKEQFQLGL